MSIALVASLRSEDPYLQVGAAAFDAEYRLLSTGYNGLKSGFSLTRKEWKDRDGRLPFILHAELNCLSRCVRGEVKIIAVTTLPCGSCASAIVAHGIETVLYGQPYHRDSSSLTVFKRYGIKVKLVPAARTANGIAAALSRIYP
jgi:dCMP deaminase